MSAKSTIGKLDLLLPMTSYTKAKDGAHPCVQLSRVSLSQVSAEHKRSEPGKRAREADSAEEGVFGVSWMGSSWGLLLLAPASMTLVRGCCCLQYRPGPEESERGASVARL